MKRTTRFAATIAAASLALAACSSDSDDKKDADKPAGDDTQSSETNGDEGEGEDSNDGEGDGENADLTFDYNETPYDEVKDGGTLTTAIAELSEQANPFHQDATAYSSELWRWYNPQFAYFDGDGTWHYHPAYFDDVVEDEVDGNTVVTFKIKEEAQYNDGTPIDYRTFEAIWKSNNGESDDYAPNSTDGYSQIKSVEPGETDKEAVVTFDGTYAWWQGLFNMGMHPEIADPTVYAEGFVQQVHPEWGAGPYKVENIDFQKGEATFVPNEKWWGDKAKLDKRVFKEMESQASLNAFKNGETDATGVGTEERLTAVEDMTGIEIRKGARPFSALMMLNSDSEHLADIDVRKAIFEGVNREVIAGIVFQGIDYSETPPGSFTLFSIQDGYEDNFSKAVQYNPADAQKTLEEAGWTDSDGDGIREKDGEKLTLTLPVLGDSKTSKDMAAAYQSMMKAIGIDLQIEERPTSDFSQVISQKEFDLFGLAFSSSDPFGVAYFEQIYGSDSGLNRSGTGTPELDAKIEEMKKIADRDEQIKAANELEVEAFKTYGIIPLYNGPDYIAVKEGLANFGAYGFAIVPVETIGWEK